MSSLFNFSIFLIIYSTFLCGLLFIGLGLTKIYHAIVALFGEYDRSSSAIMLVKSLDLFLIAVVFIIFSIGFGQLYLPKSMIAQKFNIPAIQIKSISELKTFLWSTLLLTLVVHFVANLVSHEGPLEWSIIIIPASILFLALALKFLRH